MWQVVQPFHPRRMLVAAGLAGALALSACSTLSTTVDYYWQSAQGQWDLILRAQPIPDVIEQTNDKLLKARLARVREIREYASKELGLPANGSYMRYTELGRPFVLWNVFATSELSLKPFEWCYPIAGCVNYRGYFREEEARSEATRLRERGEDVYIGGVPAYSTLGYFDDPVLSSFVRWPETEIARLIFHELAHQLIYVPGDSGFNESYAVAVEEAGVLRWLARQKNAKLNEQFARTQRLRAAFRSLVADTRSELIRIYTSNQPPSTKREAKRAAFAAMRASYEQMKMTDPGMAGYDRWFADNPNNASLAAIALYTDRVPAFTALLKQEGGNFPRFYDRVRELAALDRNKRDAVLAGLTQPSQTSIHATAASVPVARAPRIGSTAAVAAAAAPVGSTSPVSAGGQ